MSVSSSRRKSCGGSNEVTTSLVRKCVAYLRKPGVGTDQAFRVLADELATTHWRMRVAYYEEGSAPITDADLNTFRRRIGRFFLNLERKHLALAAQCRAEHDAIVDQLEEEGTCAKKSGRKYATVSGLQYSAGSGGD